jgi:hypothetical protein
MIMLSLITKIKLELMAYEAMFATEQSCRGSDSNVELNDTRGNETSSPLHT